MLIPLYVKATRARESEFIAPVFVPPEIQQQGRFVLKIDLDRSPPVYFERPRTDCFHYLEIDCQFERSVNHSIGVEVAFAIAEVKVNVLAKLHEIFSGPTRPILTANQLD